MLIRHYKSNTLKINGVVKDKDGNVVTFGANDKVWFILKERDTETPIALLGASLIGEGRFSISVEASIFRNLPIGEYLYEFTFQRGDDIFTLIKSVILLLAPVKTVW